jgi:hypothetical protein
MEVTDIQQVMFLIIDPTFLCKCLAFGAMTVTAGIVRDINASTTFTGIGVGTEFSGAAFTDGIHGFVLIE